MIVHPVEHADAATWTALQHRLWPHATVEELAGTAEAFFGAGTPDVAAAFLAWEGGVALGFIEVSVRPQVPGARRLPAPFVEGWYVEPAARHRGVGRRLNGGRREVGRDAWPSRDRLRRGLREPRRCRCPRGSRVS